MIIIKRFRHLPYILIGMLGLAIAGVSFYFLNNKYAEPVEMKDIVVTAKEIPMYKAIGNSDLKTVQVPASTDTDNYLIEYTDILGKIVKTALPSNELISSDFLADEKEMENMVFMTINTSYARTGGAKPGDIVDIYKVTTEKGDWVEGRQTTLIAKNVVVVSATTASGKNIGDGGKLSLGGSEKVEVVKLGVRPEDVKFLVPASAAVDNGYVLVVKSFFVGQNYLQENSDLSNILKQNDEVEEDGDLEDGEVVDEIIPEGSRKEAGRSRDRGN